MSLSSRLSLTDAKGERVAEYQKKSMGLSRKATMNVANWMTPGAALDEVIVTGLVVVELIRRRSQGGA